MKKTITLLLLFISFLSYSQTKYYTTNGKDRLTESEMENKISEMENDMTKKSGKKIYLNVIIQDTEIKKDSIISRVTFGINSEKPKQVISSEFMSEFKGKEFPKFTLKTLTGENFDSETLKGKPTMINFWFTGCKPCREEIPILNQIAERYKNDFNFIAITYEDEAVVKNFLKNNAFNFKHLVEAENFINTLGVSKYPVNLFLDENGTLKYVRKSIPYESDQKGGMKMGDGKEFIEIIEALK